MTTARSKKPIAILPHGSLIVSRLSIFVSREGSHFVQRDPDLHSGIVSPRKYCIYMISYFILFIPRRTYRTHLTVIAVINLPVHKHRFT